LAGRIPACIDESSIVDLLPGYIRIGDKVYRFNDTPDGKHERHDSAIACQVEPTRDRGMSGFSHSPYNVSDKHYVGHRLSGRYQDGITDALIRDLR